MATKTPISFKEEKAEGEVPGKVNAKEEAKEREPMTKKPKMAMKKGKKWTASSDGWMMK